VSCAQKDTWTSSPRQGEGRTSGRAGVYRGRVPDAEGTKDALGQYQGISSTRTTSLMHVYLRDEQVRLRMEQVEAQGLVPARSELVPMAFFAEDNAYPSFRALLPRETVEVLREALEEPVTLGLLAEEPAEASEEVHAMVGLAVPVGEDELQMDEEEDAPEEPWRASAGNADAWRGDEADEAFQGSGAPRTALLAFAPLIRIRRRFPQDFAEELADLLETALAGVTRPAMEARVDRLLEDL